jgi:uncharacterized protein (TIGR02266 family)
MITVRYKSATIEEFIQNHAHDVSSEGVYIKTNSPFSPGELMKFVLLIQGEELMLEGVGRVRWIRTPDQASDALPAGMGIRVIVFKKETLTMLEQMMAHQSGPNAYDIGAHPLENQSGPNANDIGAHPLP